MVRVAIADSCRNQGSVNVTSMIRSDNAHPVTIRVVVVTRHRLDGDALAALFHAHADFRVLCATTSIKVATVVGRHRRPDVILLDGSLISPDGDQSFAMMIDELGQLPILLLDNDVNNGRLAAILSAPSIGYFTRSAPFSELAAGIRRMVEGERVFDPAVSSRIQQTPSGWQFCRGGNGSELAALTPREIEVLKLVASGHSVRDCAELLELAPSTVDNHKARLMKKLGVHKSLELTRLAIREGLVHV
jgi:DNA-binding NarL/FixJ family response regulator